MDDKSLQTLEFAKILQRLTEYCDFAVSAERAHQLKPTNDPLEARMRQAETREAVELISTQVGMSIGGSRDIRQSVDLAKHSGVLDPTDLLDIKYTLVAARELGRRVERLAEEYPHLADIAAQFPPPMGIIDMISQSISERGEILDSASAVLKDIRRNLRIVHDRLMNKLQRMVSDPKIAPYLQEALVTQRDGRYVLPLRAEFKGRVKSVVHDQSASGATLFVEPLSTVDQNNQYRELQLAERDEERRILADLSYVIGSHAEELLHTVDIIARLDLAFAKAKYALDLRATEPILHPLPGKKSEKQEPSDLYPRSKILLSQARHPLLDSEKVVPIDVELGVSGGGTPTFIMVITGPNTGGKTVTLKTVGLLALMAQSGLHIPADPGSEISVFKDVYADIGDEQSIEQSLSTFSSHINNIIRILNEADNSSLVVLDELGAGTDPQEGAALARALLFSLVNRGITTLVTTHHPELKAYAYGTPGITNASMEFDLETLQPTFHLTIGLPGRSNALAIAERLGLPEVIISEARRELDPDELRAEDLLDEIHRQRDAARQSRLAADLARKNAETLRLELIERLENIDQERLKILEDARAETRDNLRELQNEISSLKKRIDRLRQPQEAIQEVQEAVDGLEQKLPSTDEKVEFKMGKQWEAAERARRRDIRLGDKVRLRKLGTQGLVTALSGDEAELQMGGLRVKAELSEIELVAPREEIVEEEIIIPQVQQGVTFQPAPSESPGIELDLRGLRADDALDKLERYIEAAYLSGLPFARIIHGKGTGKLRQVVRQSLSENTNVRSFQSGEENEGGSGVTVVKF